MTMTSHILINYVILQIQQFAYFIYIIYSVNVIMSSVIAVNLISFINRIQNE